MAVLVLMYHQTPEVSAQDFYDVPMPLFRDQINQMVDAGVSFVRFSDVNRTDIAGKGMHVAVTFDDGHASNAGAISFLANHGITPASFVVRDWARDDRAFLSGSAISDLREVCEFGGHGTTHIDLTSLSDAGLADELSASREFLEDALGKEIDTMALPGGKGDARVYRFAKREKYRLVGNSRSLTHTRTGASINRVCVYSNTDPRDPCQMALASPLFWTMRRARGMISNSASAILGDQLYGKMLKIIK